MNKYSQLFFILLFSIFGTTTNAENENNKPNILIVLCDDAGYADFGFMGSKDIQTPVIDKLAKAGTIFTDAHTTATVCSPSRAGLLTGRYQQRFGHECNLPPHGLGMGVGEKTIGDLVKQAGYRTGLFGKWHLGETNDFHPNNRGFDTFYGFLEGSRSYYYGADYDVFDDPHAVELNGKKVEFDGYLTDVLAEKALDFIKQSKDEPWLTFLSYNAVHSPMEATEEDLSKFKGMPRQKLAAMTWAMDRSLGTIIDYLKQSKTLENTLIFFLSDNGGANNNQSSCGILKGWKGNKFEGGHRVPFFVTWVNTLPSNRSVDQLTSALDINKTICSLIGVKNTSNLDGANLMPLLKQESKQAPHDKLFWRKDEMAAVRWGKWKLVRLDDYGFVLYDLKKDISETKDLKKKYPKICCQMLEDLMLWEEQMIAPLWLESKEWSDVTWGIHKDLMNNRKPSKMAPGK